MLGASEEFTWADRSSIVGDKAPSLGVKNFPFVGPSMVSPTLLSGGSEWLRRAARNPLAGAPEEKPRQRRAIIQRSVE